MQTGQKKKKTNVRSVLSGLEMKASSKEYPRINVITRATKPAKLVTIIDDY
jgi:hypothetical protein